MATSKTCESTSLKADEFWSRFIQPRLVLIQNVSPLDSAESVEHARQTLDAELDAMTWAICHLRMCRNALSLMSSLPPELLARIFHFSAALMPPSRNSLTHPGPLGWIHLTHVCKRWRDTALQHPSLWGNIYSGFGVHWRTLLLARAKSGSLSLSFPSLESGDIHLISDHLSHTRHLSLSTSHDILREASQLFTSPATILSSLELHANAAGNSGNIVLPENLFSSHTPMLRQVHLDGISLSWTSPIFSNLTNLRVNHYPPGRFAVNDVVENDTSAPQYDDFFDALARMPNLETLHLHRCLPQRSQESPAREHLTVLSHLKQLSMSGTSAVCIDILTHFKIPSSCKLKLHCLEGLQPPIDDFLPFIEAFSQDTEDPPLQTLLISFFSNLGDRSIDIKLWRTCDAVDAAVPTYHLYNSECDISLQFPISSESTGLLEALCQVLPLDDLRVLSVNGYHGSWSGSWPAQSWINMFGRCRAVERVDVNHGIAVQFCKALVLPVGCSPTASGAPQTLDQLFLRELRSLTISNLNFSIITGEDNKQFINELMILLRQRADYCQNAIGPSGGSDVEAVDRRLARFSILSCSIGQNQVSDLAQVVQDIVWDNHEGEYGVPAEPNWDVYEDMESDGGASEDEDVGSAGSQADSDSSEGF